MVTLVSERFLYLPLLGLVLVVGAALAAADATWRRRGYALVAACGVALAAIALSRSADFSDETRFWARELRLHPDSPQAHSFALEQAMRDGRFKDGLRILGDIQRAGAGYDLDLRIEIEVAYNTVFALSHLTPDHDVAGLRALDAFCKALVQPSGPTAKISLRGVQLVVGTAGEAYAKIVAKYQASFEDARADLASRLGDDAAAIAHATEARRHCTWCAPQVVAEALARARGGQYAPALAVLDGARGRVPEEPLAGVRTKILKAQAAMQRSARELGPAQLQARAEALAALELWGRAYDVLAPYKVQIMHAARFAGPFAELAFRAGETAVAREVLTAVAPADEVEPTLRAWADAMGWLD